MEDDSEHLSQLYSLQMRQKKLNVGHRFVKCEIEFYYIITIFARTHKRCYKL